MPLSTELPQLTTFTIDTDQVENLQAVLTKLVAVPIQMFPQLENGVKSGTSFVNGLGILEQFGCHLGAGTKFFVPQRISRRKLTKMLGQRAWVRGVNK